ncbi:hypothetical protein AAG570_006130 [Ranatra chinensis]|uniref:Uncharacterized protein n=1 Tax=Ranatra chinensis TaxID=642074 RepID=A0ABD0XZR2_9HEMI
MHRQSEGDAVANSDLPTCWSGELMRLGVGPVTRLRGESPAAAKQCHAGAVGQEGGAVGGRSDGGEAEEGWRGGPDLDTDSWPTKRSMTSPPGESPPLLPTPRPFLITANLSRAQLQHFSFFKPP